MIKKLKLLIKSFFDNNYIIKEFKLSLKDKV